MAKRPERRIPPLEPKSFASVDQIDHAIRKLRWRIEEVEKLKESRAKVFTQDVKNVESNIRGTILDVFGENSPEFREHGRRALGKAPSRRRAGPGALNEEGVPGARA